MRKKDLERARAQFSGNQALDAEALRAKVKENLGLVSTAHDTAEIALTEITKLLRNVAFDERPGRAVSDLSRAYESVVRSIIALRGEARATIAETGTNLAQVEALPGESASADPPAPRGEGEWSGTTLPPKISLPQARPGVPPLALSEFLKQNTGVIDAEFESGPDEGVAGPREGSPGSPGLPVFAGKAASEGAGDD